MTSGLHINIWLPLIVGIPPVIAATIRSSILLIGLIVTLAKADKADRPSIFRAFARAMSVPLLHRGGNSLTTPKTGRN
jgi:hypothetical protein